MRQSIKDKGFNKTTNMGEMVTEAIINEFGVDALGTVENDIKDIINESESGKLEVPEEDRGIKVLSSEIIEKHLYYVVKKEEWQHDPNEPTTPMVQAYNHNGDYIGNVQEAEYICDTRGINPEVITKGKTCNIGFCEKEQRWYGFSQRGIYGFGIGSKITKSSCAYVSPSKLDFIRDIRLSSKLSSTHSSYVRVSQQGVTVVSKFLGDPEDPSQDKYIGKVSESLYEYPTVYGKGEWAAKTLEDAKQMAIDFARSIS